MRHHAPHANEEGSILLLTLVLLVLLTIAGLGGLSTTNTELTISGNDRCFKQSLTLAESAVMEAAQLMENDTDPTTNLKPPETDSESKTSLEWINSDPDADTSFDPLTQDWTYGTNASLSFFTEDPSDTDNLSGFTAIYKGIAHGASLDMSSSSTMRQYEIVGRAEQCNGLLDVIAGYRIRF